MICACIMLWLQQTYAHVTDARQQRRIKRNMLRSCNRVRQFFGAAPLKQLPGGRVKNVYMCSGRESLRDAVKVDLRIYTDHAYVDQQFAAMMAEAFGTKVVPCNCGHRGRDIARCYGDAHVELPPEWQQFIAEFDEGKFPELIAG